MSNEVVVGIAEKVGKTAAQVLLRYTVQRGIAVIPKSTNPGRLRENIEVPSVTFVARSTILNLTCIRYNREAV